MVGINYKQGELFEALRLRDDGMEEVLENSERSIPDFKDRATTFVLSYLNRQIRAPGEEITNACKAAGIIPHDDRAFGPIYYSLAKQGLIFKTGTCLRLRGHGTTGGNIWELRQ
jgi:hypothetical protein